MWFGLEMLNLYSSTWCIPFCIRLRKCYLIVSLEMLDFYSLTRYTARGVSVRSRQLLLILSLKTRFVDYFPRITQSITGINKKAWQFISMVYKIYTTTYLNLRDFVFFSAREQIQQSDWFLERAEFSNTERYSGRNPSSWSIFVHKLAIIVNLSPFFTLP